MTVATHKPGISALAEHWAILLAAMAGWALDAFDFALMLFLIPHLKDVFGVGLPAMAFVVTATGLAKVVGTIGWGMAADRLGRKLPFMLSILWFSVFCGLSGLAWSYTSLLVLRILFGLGFGGEWSTSATLLMESVPEGLKGVASGIMMLGFEVGFLAAALVFRTVFPLLGWRWMLILGVVPALFVLLVQSAVKESPVWQAGRGQGHARARLALNPAVIQAWALMAFLNFMSWAIFALYPTFLISVRHLSPAGVFPFIATYSIASIIGKPIAGRVVAMIGERAMLISYLLLTIPSVLLYTLNASPWAMVAGAVLMGLIPNSIFGIVPMYLARRFAPEVRGLGLGIGWAMTSVSVVAPYLIALVTPITGLGVAMAGFIVVGALASIATAAVDTSHHLPQTAGASA
ncbi:MAG: MFS transporter [Rhodospirillales bacterium]|nr:MFS transporter [Rhodospirillales bacterium]